MVASSTRTERPTHKPRRPEVRPDLSLNTRRAKAGRLDLRAGEIERQAPKTLASFVVRADDVSALVSTLSDGASTRSFRWLRRTRSHLASFQCCGVFIRQAVRFLQHGRSSWRVLFVRLRFSAMAAAFCCRSVPSRPAIRSGRFRIVAPAARMRYASARPPPCCGAA